jgi:hypothetical protein
MTVNQKFYYIRRLGDTESRDIKAFNFITMELMQKYIKAGETVEVNDLRRWPSNFLIMAFLLETTSATSVKKLMKINERIQFSENIQSNASNIRYLVVYEKIRIFKG